eukprot:m.46424 g.46424  ORF g.46424 m.46424 type:complete len:117 (+) comp10371_c0_seq3:152-502(+)
MEWPELFCTLNLLRPEYGRLGDLRSCSLLAMPSSAETTRRISLGDAFGEPLGELLGDNFGDTLSPFCEQLASVGRSIVCGRTSEELIMENRLGSSVGDDVLDRAVGYYCVTGPKLL